jgi:sirohydrochlorin ferrochelatase
MSRAPALIVAHGSPSCPPSQEFWLADLAARAEAAGAGPVIGTTLAARRPFARAIAEAMAKDGPLIVYPMFMADGWFSQTELPRRLIAAGADVARLQVLTPFGLDPLLPALCARRAVEAAMAAGIDPRGATLVVAAHGAPKHKRPAEVTWLVARGAARIGGFARLACGFVDQAPFLADALRIDGPAICLPFFATRASHVLEDLPEALNAAGFAGPVLAPIGLDQGLPEMIAAAILRARR